MMFPIPVIISFLLFLITTVNSYGVGFVRDITCPPPPNFGNTCKMVCPPGYRPAPNSKATNFAITGVFSCVPVLRPGEDTYVEYKTCTYFNPNCGGSKSEREAVGKFVKENLGELLKAGNETDSSYVDQLIHIAMFDPDYAENLETKEPSAFYLFFYDTLKEVNDKLFDTEVVYLFFGIVWISLFFATAFIFSRQVENPKLHGARILAAISLFFFPFPTGKTYEGKEIWQPISFEFVRDFVYMGNSAANKLAEVMNEVFIKHVLTKTYSDFTKTQQKIENDMPFKLQQIRIYENALRKCWSIWGGEGTDFIVPEDELAHIPLIRAVSGDEAKMYSRIACADYEKHYKSAVTDYNRNVAALNMIENVQKGLEQALSVSVEQIMENPEEYANMEAHSDSEKTVKEIAYVALWQKKLGWISYPLITLPIVQMNNAGSDMLAFSIDVKSKPSRFVRAIGVLSFPPGSWIFAFLAKMVKESITTIATVVGALGGSIFGPEATLASGLMGLAAGLVVKTIGMGTLYLLTAYISYMLASAILNMLPILLLIIAFTYRLIFWCIDLVKIMVISPFLVLHATTAKRYELMWRWFARILAIALYPVMLLISAFAAYFSVNLIKYLDYYLIVKGIDTLAELGFISWRSLVVPFLHGLIYWISMVAAGVIAYKIIIRSPEWFLELFGLSDLQQVSGGGIAREMTETFARKAGSPV